MYHGSTSFLCCRARQTPVSYLEPLVRDPGPAALAERLHRRYCSRGSAGAAATTTTGQCRRARAGSVRVLGAVALPWDLDDQSHLIFTNRCVEHVHLFSKTRNNRWITLILNGIFVLL